MRTIVADPFWWCCAFLTVLVFTICLDEYRHKRALRAGASSSQLAARTGASYQRARRHTSAAQAGPAFSDTDMVLALSPSDVEIMIRRLDGKPVTLEEQDRCKLIARCLDVDLAKRARREWERSR